MVTEWISQLLVLVSQCIIRVALKVGGAGVRVAGVGSGGVGGGRGGGAMHNYIIPLMVTTKQRYGDYADGGDGDDTR